MNEQHDDRTPALASRASRHVDLPNLSHKKQLCPGPSIHSRAYDFTKGLSKCLPQREGRFLMKAGISLRISLFPKWITTSWCLLLPIGLPFSNQLIIHHSCTMRRPVCFSWLSRWVKQGLERTHWGPELEFYVVNVRITCVLSFSFSISLLCL